MINCHLCGKTVSLLKTHLQRTHKWTKKEAKEFHEKALSAYKKISKDKSDKHLTTDISSDIPSTSFLQKAQTISNESFHSVAEPRRELSWTEMDRFDRYGAFSEKSATNNKNANYVSKIIDSYLNGIVIHLDETYANLHQELSKLIIDGRSNDRDIVDGHMDVTVYLHSVLKPSLQMVIDGNVLEMRRLYNQILGGGFVRV